ncbi:hypothetical protein RvY_06857 [Ramazzottius varieornatus]|uniref:Uncharacterized protein n=1 Tax=Ramazzottius varieornatus TaxID=947166 RepID=A0A1D1V9L6_RAMVA|nr:hypothetical protein RvY_06857 [Ramazzottius varieornatus]
MSVPQNTAGLCMWFPNFSVRNLTSEFFCFNPKNASTAIKHIRYRNPLNQTKMNASKHSK